MCVHAWVCVRCTCVWWPQGHLGCHPQKHHLLPLRRNLTFLKLGRLDWLASEPRDTPGSVFPVLVCTPPNLGLLSFWGPKFMSSCLYSELQGASCFHILSIGITSTCHHASFLMWLLESKLRPLHLQNKHLTFPQSHTRLVFKVITDIWVALHCMLSIQHTYSCCFLSLPPLLV